MTECINCDIKIDGDHEHTKDSGICTTEGCFCDRLIILNTRNIYFENIEIGIFTMAEFYDSQWHVGVTVFKNK
jgi:hypothetical protein